MSTHTHVCTYVNVCMHTHLYLFFVVVQWCMDIHTIKRYMHAVTELVWEIWGPEAAPSPSPSHCMRRNDYCHDWLLIPEACRL